MRLSVPWPTLLSAGLDPGDLCDAWGRQEHGPGQSLPRAAHGTRSRLPPRMVDPEKGHLPAALQRPVESGDRILLDPCPGTAGHLSYLPVTIGEGSRADRPGCRHVTFSISMSRSGYTWLGAVRSSRADRLVTAMVSAAARAMTVK